jgi:hypothetical protein
MKMDSEMIDVANRALAQYFECDKYKVVADPHMDGGVYIEDGGQSDPLSSDVNMFAHGCIWSLLQARIGTLEKSRWVVRWVWAQGIKDGKPGSSEPFLVEAIARATYDDYVTRKHIREVELVRHDVMVIAK